MVRPVVAQGGRGEQGSNSEAAANLMQMPKLSFQPKDLYVLWAKWEHGLSGTKPAKLFTRRERGANKFAFSRHRVFWDMIVSLVARGHTSDLAVNKVYGIYGRALGVTEILNRMKRDKKEQGGHRELRAAA